MKLYKIIRNRELGEKNFHFVGISWFLKRILIYCICMYISNLGIILEEKLKTRANNKTRPLLHGTLANCVQVKGVRKVKVKQFSSPVFSKMLEQIRDIHIKSLETMLHKVLGQAGKVIHQMQMALLAFLDREIAFNNVTTDAAKLDLESANTEWIIVKHARL